MAVISACSGFWNLETQTNVALTRQVINFVRSDLHEYTTQRGGIIQGVVEE
jgi:hypothetical protein